MRQLVGEACVICTKQIGSILEGVFCAMCGSPVHNRCVASTVDSKNRQSCATCGASAEVVKREQQLHGVVRLLLKAVRPDMTSRSHSG